ncbi:TetR family transcriptional regulator [Actinokineospora sp. 24-640]
MASPTPLRRQPVQQRSAKRVQRMLDACAELIEELGYDGVTTTLIAERAGVAVGSLYQFFPDKRAVVQALTQRNFGHFTAEIHRRFDETPVEHWALGADIVFDLYVEMYREIPGFRRVRFGDVVDIRLIDGERDNNTVIAEHIAAFLAERFAVPLAEIRLPVAVAHEIADSILNLAFRRSLFPEDTVISEAKMVVRAYLSGQLETWR